MKTAGILTVIFFSSFLVPNVVAAPIDFDLNTEDGIRSYIALEASKIGLDSTIPTRIVQLESSFRVGAVGDSGAAHCLAQFHKETFYRMQESSKDNPMYKWGDERTCIRLLVWALENGHGSEWSTYRK